MKRKMRKIVFSVVVSALLLTGALTTWLSADTAEVMAQEAIGTETLAAVLPAFDGIQPAVIVNGNQPLFTEADKRRTDAFEVYGELDALGRCTTAYANICTELMPTKERGSIGMVQPSGWHTVKYPEVISDLYLYNRCHLIGYQLAGENDNVKNLITGTRYLNIEGMLPYENLVADYVHRTGNHVLYRTTPVFAGTDLVASGVEIEAWSVEDNGAGVCFNVYCYNEQPGIAIDHATGDSSLSGTQTLTAGTQADTDKATANATGITVWLSATGSKYHSINNCGNMNPAKARQVTEQEAISMGKGKCSKCW